MDLTTPIAEEKLNTLLTELRHGLIELYGPRLARLILYGSQARGDAEPGSDIDVMVVLAGKVKVGDEIRRTGELVASISLQYDELISRIFVSVEQFDNEDSPLLINVRKEGVVLYEPTAVSAFEKSVR